jgi:two-component system NtrC family sensor kinase
MSMSPAKLEVCNRELVEALDQQVATSEILRVIAGSSVDPQAVFEMIVTNAARLCEANFAFVMLNQHGRLTLAARTACTPEFAEFLSGGKPPNRTTTTGRAALERRPVQVLDFLADPGVVVTEAHRTECVRTVLAVPMCRDDRLLGVISVWRREVRPFSDQQIRLLETFGNQAVVAIENVRLLQELQTRNRDLSTALERQTAMAEILRVISSSPSDALPVFETMVRRAVTLCGSLFANVFRFDGELLHYVASHNTGPDYEELLRSKYPMRPDISQVSGRVILSESIVRLEDALADPNYDQRFPAVIGWRRALGVPMLQDGKVLGVIVVGWVEPGPVSKAQEELLQTFADQAVIAVENARLFNELEARNRELSEALEQQTATSEILRAISQSPTDVRPVFDTIAAAAMKLCGASSANVFTFDGTLLHAAAIKAADPRALEPIRQSFPRPPDRRTVASRAVLTRGPVAIPDTLEDHEYGVEGVARWGFRSVVGVPLMREGAPIGALALGRAEPGLFPERQVALLRTFADQAVIAIENARLFDEVQARTRELSEALEYQTATSDVLNVISRSPTQLQPVLDAIVNTASRLCAAEYSYIARYEDGALYLAAQVRMVAEHMTYLFGRPTSIDRGAVIGRVALEKRAIHVPDVLADPEFDRFEWQKVGKQRTVLGVPLLRQSALIGVIILARTAVEPFTQRQIELVTIFADQAVIAIENARLFDEIQDKSRQLEIASQHKSAFLANMSHELRTPLNAIIGFTRIVMRRSQEQIDPKQYENLERILTSSQHLLSLINTILDLAKIEAGYIQITVGEIQLTPVLEQCMRTVEPLVKDTVKLTKAFDGELPAMLVDEEKLRQIVINLLSNAAKFTARGAIKVQAHQIEDYVEIAVCDTGIGIAAEKLELIFEEFEQADATSTRQYGGTGLGLAIARRLARLMGGDISAESSPGAGSTFILALPIRYESSRV